MTEVATRERLRPHTIAVVLALWGFAYACYRAYYAMGGTVGMIGTPVTAVRFQAINASGAVIIMCAAVLPLVGVRARLLRRAMPALSWVGAVGCCMHALVDGTLRVLSVTGVHPTELPSSMWLSFDRHAADLQDLVLNEPWFLVEGLLWGALGLSLVDPRRRRAWLVSAVVACLLLTVVGVLSGVGVLGTFHLG